MTLTRSLRRFVLTTHLACSVGWLGAVIVFLALAVLGMTSRSAQIVRGAYLVMEPAAWWVLVPLAAGSLLTGIVQSWGTPWGFFRHYWVVFKLTITIAATAILLIYMGTFRQMAAAAGDPNVALSAVRNPSPALHSTLALLALLVATVLAVYKPLGLTAYGQRVLLAREAGDRRAPAPPTVQPSGDKYVPGARWTGYLLMAVLAAILLLLALHLAGGGMRGH